MDTLTAPPEAPTQAPPHRTSSPPSSPPLFVGGTSQASPPSTASTKFTSVVPRGERFMQEIADQLAAWGASPRGLSIAGVVSVAVAALLLPVGGLVPTGVGAAALVVAALGIQLRPFLDRVADRIADGSGRPALHGGVPDLLADAAVMIGAGYAISATAAGPVLGWSAGLIGAALAYVDLLGPGKWPVRQWVEVTAPKYRMVAMTAVCLVAAFLPSGWQQPSFLMALTVVAGACSFALWARVAKR